MFRRTFKIICEAFKTVDIRRNYCEQVFDFGKAKENMYFLKKVSFTKTNNFIWIKCKTKLFSQQKNSNKNN